MSETIKIDPKLYYIAAALVFCVAGATAVSVPYAEVKDDSVLPFEASYDNTASYRLEDEVFNVIENMQSGVISPNAAKNYIQDEKIYAKQYIDGNAVETGVNLRYVSYLNAAIDVTIAYGNGKNEQELNEYLEIMQVKKDLI